MAELIPVSTIIPTANRLSVLIKAIKTIELQEFQPKEIIIIDASDEFIAGNISNELFDNLISKIIHLKATEKGAAIQREYGISFSNQPYLFFMDDDVYLNPNCLELLWKGINSSEEIGGVNALIVNQQFHPLGIVSKIFYRLFTSKEKLKNIQGKSIGPCVNFLCNENNKNEIIPVDWLNLGATIYKKSALPCPVFDKHFKGYSYGEDAALSFIVARKWSLFTIRDAKVFHDSQPGNHKNNLKVFTEEELVNRYYIMTKILKKNNFRSRVELIILEVFKIIASKDKYVSDFWKGKWNALKKISQINE